MTIIYFFSKRVQVKISGIFNHNTTSTIKSFLTLGVRQNSILNHKALSFYQKSVTEPQNTEESNIGKKQADCMKSVPSAKMFLM